jgi:uncharacterized protein YdaU (DUF1376 family)
MNYYPFHLGDYAAHTAHLEPMEDLAYRRLIDQYYLREGPLPADIQVTAKLVRMRSMVADVESVLKEFFTLTAAGWMHNRCEAEIAEMQERQQIAKDKSNKRWDMQRAEHSNAAAQQNNAAACAAAQKDGAGEMLPNTNTNTNTNTNKKTKNTSAIAPPDGVVESVWMDFVDLRKAKKAKLTQTAIDGITTEARKAGWALEDALRECCARGWIGFKADWVADKPPTRQAESFRERDDRLARERYEEATGQRRKVIDITPEFLEIAQ